MKAVKRADLKKLVYAVFRLFEAQDDECADKRKVSARERAVNRYLDNISSSKEEHSACPFFYEPSKKLIVIRFIAWLFVVAGVSVSIVMLFVSLYKLFN